MTYDFLHKTYDFCFRMRCLNLCSIFFLPISPNHMTYNSQGPRYFLPLLLLSVITDSHLNPLHATRLTKMPGPASSYTAFAFNVLVSKLHKASHLSLSKFSALPSSSDSDTVIDENEKYPMFVTWNIYDKRYHGYILRGCIGTFVPHLALEKELESYALKA